MRNVPKLSSNSIGMLVSRLHKKAMQSQSKIRISAMAFDHRGEFLARTFNSVPPPGIPAKYGAGIHAEAKLIRKYGGLIKTIIISRIGHGGDWRPIEPCENCKKLANKHGIKIITIDECK